MAARSRATTAVPSAGYLRVASVLPVLASGSGPRRLPAAVGRLRSPPMAVGIECSGLESVMAAFDQLGLQDLTRPQFT